MTGDPFGTGALRRVVLAAWAASPARFREDANAEEALAIGGYADRLLIELAANGVDAARENGAPGRVRFSLTDVDRGVQLRVANVGVPLTADGVAGLASLRASAKRGHAATVGHFGVGFTAVLTVTDEPQVVSRTGGVRFSRTDTASAVVDLGVTGLDREMTARTGQVPALRLPWPAESGDPVPPGFDTEVRLPLRAGLREPLVELLLAVGDDLLWALPGLMTVEIDVPGRATRVISREDLDDGTTVIEDGGTVTAYRSATRSGTIPVALLGDRPIEERDRNAWQLTWILAVDRPAPVLGFDLDPVIEPMYLGAPTPTDEPLSLPARLVGTFPVDDTRRRLAPGALTDYLLDQAAAEYSELFTAVAVADRFALVPAAGFPLGPVDGALRQGIVRRLARAPVMVTVLDVPVVPAQACVVVGVSDAAGVLLGRAIPGLLLPPRSPGQLEAMRLLGVSTLPLAEAISSLAGLDGSPVFWHEVYEALSDQNAEDLANLPIPLSGGGRRIGPAGSLLPGPGALEDALLDRAVTFAPELRIVHPDAVHPLLGRLGGVPADAAALLTDPALTQLFHEFRQDLEDADPDPDELRDLARLALDLCGDTPVADALLSESLLADVVLTDAGGEAWPAGELLLPGAPLAAVLAADADLPMIGPEWTGYPPSALAAIGVRTGVKIVQVQDAEADLPDLERWWSEVVGDSLPPEPFDAVADLDLVDDGRWPQLLDMLSGDRRARDTLDAQSGPEPSYTRWWLTHFASIDGETPDRWKLPAAVGLAGLYDELPVVLDVEVALAIGVLDSSAAAVRADAAEFVRRLADPERLVDAWSVPALTAVAVDVLRGDQHIPLPGSVRVLDGSVIDADDALVLDLPWFAQVVGADRLVAGGDDPERVARALDLDLASVAVAVEIVAGEIDAVGTGAAVAGRGERPASGSAVAGLPTEAEQAAAQRSALALGVALADVFPAGTLLTMPGLSVRPGRGPSVVVRWWSAPERTGVDRSALVTDGSPEGIGRAVAWRAGRWKDRETAVAAARGDVVTFGENGRA
ncbi:hypothetical protein ABIB25_001279 [Nakamurella sp. UYEF19]|uniref:sacsin N-terminal ATP-binding-like domain-containing protein n=1 Tax=Nakamurella sp. UYEF19 TaxID=1756392 RepID=UPI003398F9D0